MRRPRVSSNVTRSIEIRDVQRSPEVAFRSTDFRVLENLIFPALLPE